MAIRPLKFLEYFTVHIYQKRNAHRYYQFAMNFLARTVPIRARISRHCSGIALAALLLLSGRQPHADLLVHLKMDESSGTIAHNATGKNDGQVNESGANFVSGGV